MTRSLGVITSHEEFSITGIYNDDVYNVHKKPALVSLIDGQQKGVC